MKLTDFIKEVWNVSKELFIRTSLQREWLEKLLKYEKDFKEDSQENDKQSSFPKKMSTSWLKWVIQN